MTAKRRLVPASEVVEMIALMRAQGIEFSGIDVRSDGVAFLPANHQPGNAYDRYKAKDAGRDRP
jgi:hypothetical protein